MLFFIVSLPLWSVKREIVCLLCTSVYSIPNHISFEKYFAQFLLIFYMPSRRRSQLNRPPPELVPLPTVRMETPE